MTRTGAPICGAASPARPDPARMVTVRDLTRSRSGRSNSVTGSATFRSDGSENTLIGRTVMFAPHGDDDTSMQFPAGHPGNPDMRLLIPCCIGYAHGLRVSRVRHM